MPINTRHPEYEQQYPRWVRMDHVCDGEDAVKKAGEAYLPMPNKDLGTKAVKARYENLKDRAVFVEVTKDTLDKYTGQAFKDDPILNVDERMQYMKRDANGSGVSIYQLGQKAFESQLKHGRCGLLVDYPSTGGEISLADAERKAIRPTISFYGAKSIINWRTTTEGGRVKLSMLVLEETVNEVDLDDEFVTKQVKQWRRLGLDEVGYFVEIWREDESVQDGDAKFTMFGDRIYPKKHNGDHWDRILFIPIGSDTNDWCIQGIPLESLAKVNLAHYRNSAAYEDSVHYCGQIQPWMSGVDKARLEHYEKQDIRIGSGTLLMLGDNGSFGYAQAEPNILAGEAMDKKYVLMMELGAKLSESQGTQKTATQSDHEAGSQNSIASMCIANLNEAMHDALMLAYEYIGIEHKCTAGEFLFKAKQDFVAPKPDPAMIQSIAGLVQTRLAPRTLLYGYLRRYNLLDPEFTDDDIEGAIDSEQPSLLDKAFSYE